MFPERTYYLCAKSGVEADEWIKILRWKLVRWPANSSLFNGSLLCYWRSGSSHFFISMAVIKMISQHINNMNCIGYNIKATLRYRHDIHKTEKCPEVSGTLFTVNPEVAHPTHALMHR